MAWYLAKSLDTLRSQVNAAWPNRSKSMDGTIGDAAHASRKSDHNPNSAGAVRALDLTHDPPYLDAHALADRIIAAARAGRQSPGARYVISNRRIAGNRDFLDDNGYSGSPWTWMPYKLSSPHTEHIHVSAAQEAALYDSTQPWELGATPAAPAERPPDTLRRGSQGEDVEVLQWLLRTPLDGDFGGDTEAAVKAFQRTHGLVADGVVGALTWDKLRDRVSPAAPPVPPPVGVDVFRTTGKMSTFGGPADTGGKPDEGLALFNTEAEMRAHGLGDFLLPPNGMGLFRRLDPSKPYIACRWDYTKTPKSLLQDATAMVEADGKSLAARPVDWGPNVSTGRAVDLSPGLARALGLETDDTCTVTIRNRT